MEMNVGATSAETKATAATDESGNSREWSARPARPDDLASVRKLLGSVRLPDDGVEDHFGEGYVVAEAGGRVVGSAGVEVYESYGLLRSLAVSPKWQGGRIGRSLVLDRLYWAKSKGLVSVFLVTTTPRFFHHLGFREVDRNSIPAPVRFSKELTSVCPETAPAMMIAVNGSPVPKREDVRDKYAAIARSIRGRRPKTSCCGPGQSEKANPITSNLYTDGELTDVPDGAAAASLGCGNPTALAELEPGEVVLDLGSGGGIDVLLSARRVGPTGKAYGLDMTDEMLEIARENQRKSGVENVEFLKGEMEAIPLPDDSVDVVISNCVINLSTDKRRVLAEALRVLKPGGRFAVSDVVATGPVPDHIRADAELWMGCIAGTLEETEYRAMLNEVGFGEVSVEATRIYRAEDLCGDFGDKGAEIDGKFMSAFVRAVKPRR